MPDKISRFVIGFDGDEGTIASVLAGIKSKVRSTVSEIEATTRNVELFKGLQESLTATEAAGARASAAIVQIQQKIDLLKASGQGIDKTLNASLVAAERDAAALSKQYSNQSAALDKIRVRLTAASCVRNR